VISPPTLQTDGQTTYHGNTALRYASRSKNHCSFWNMSLLCTLSIPSFHISVSFPGNRLRQNSQQKTLGL